MQDYWFPWFPSRFTADTMHLTVTEDGAYRRLIDHYMVTKLPLPNDENALSRACGMPIADFKQVSSKVLAFFFEKDGFLYNKKCEKILLEQREMAEKRRERASKGGLAKSKKSNKINTKPASSRAQALLKPAQAVLKCATEHNITEHNSNNKQRVVSERPVRPEGMSDRDYYFFLAGPIKLHEADYNRWLEMFPNITDEALENILIERGKWLQSNPSKAGNWFIRTQKYLEGINSRGG